MDNGILQSISTRREALHDHYNLPAGAQAKVDGLFRRMEELGATCRDQAEFETKLTASPLNDEYMALFTEFAPYVKTPDNVPTNEEYVGNVAKGHAKSIAENRLENSVKGAIVNALPNEITDWKTYGIYNIPIIGDIVSAFNKVHFIKRVFRKTKNHG